MKTPNKAWLRHPPAVFTAFLVLIVCIIVGFAVGQIGLGILFGFVGFLLIALDPTNIRRS